MALASLLVSLSAIGQSITFSRKHFPSSGTETVAALTSGRLTTYSYALAAWLGSVARHAPCRRRGDAKTSVPGNSAER